MRSKLDFSLQPSRNHQALAVTNNFRSSAYTPLVKKGSKIIKGQLLMVALGQGPFAMLTRLAGWHFRTHLDTQRLVVGEECGQDDPP
jgi:hypothetical protein